MNDSLVRIEYKLDLILYALMDKGIMLSEVPAIDGIEADACPVCGESISITPNYRTETLSYSCGCVLPKTIVPGISGLLPTQDVENGSSRTSDNPEVLQSEEDRRSDG